MTHKPEISLEAVEAILLAADAANQPVPETIDEQLLYYYRHRHGLRPEVNAALHRLPPERFAHFSEQLQQALTAREKELPDSTELAFAEWVHEPAFEEQWIADIVRNAGEALRTKNFYTAYHTLTSMFRDALGGSVYAVAIFDRALAELAKLDRFATSSVGALLRLMFRRVRFMALRGTTPRGLEAVLPGEDLRFVDRIDEAIGKEDPLVGLTPAEVDTLFTAWSAMNWDGTLGLREMFNRDSTPPAIETRPWPELVVHVEATSLHRLESGERQHRSLSRLFARPEPLADRIALAESIAAFAKAHGDAGHDAMQRVLPAIVPHVAAANLELKGALEAAAFRAFRAGELKDLLRTLPRRQRSAWIDKLLKAKNDKHRQLARAYADELL
ncbi:hypothetical protein [Nannocystis sp.]|uniref:hypothetical protein n=1 Tax=Nannocystis sp. TaxID=1962667 RepID=UPI0025CE696C|nr:hypothetical protein [Nannocystis sp.]MBK7830288.1 hypothetical protein [Nannocystis sp.]